MRLSWAARHEVGEVVLAFVAAAAVFLSSRTLAWWAQAQWLDGSPWADEHSWREVPIPPAVSNLSQQLRAVALEEGVDPFLVAAIARVESDFQSNARSPKGAFGLMQVMPETAAFVGMASVESPEDNVRAGCRYLKWLSADFGEDMELVLAAYNAGPGAVYRFGGIPPFPETQSFVERVRKAYAELTGQPLALAKVGP